MSIPSSSAHAASLLTLWIDADGRWHASVVMPDGERVEFQSPFELARWSRVAAVQRPADGPRSSPGLR